jgi:hypothetical protein
VRLCPSDWVLFSPGRLYCPPFVSQYLLYRLKNIDCSLLFRWESSTSSTEVDQEALIIQTRVTIRNPKEIRLHASSSARTSLIELGRARPIRVDLQNLGASYVVHGATVSLEPARLPSNRSYLILDKLAPSSVHEIEGTSYAAKIPNSLCSVPDFARNPLDGAFFESYRVSVTNEQTGKQYDVNSDQEWSLSAFGMVIDGRPLYEGTLEKMS